MTKLSEVNQTPVPMPLPTDRTVSEPIVRYWLDIFRSWVNQHYDSGALPLQHAEDALLSLQSLSTLIGAFEREVQAARSKALQEAGQHVYQHSDDVPIIHTTVTRNTKGYNYEASVTTRGDNERNKALLDEVMASLARTYGGASGGEV